MKFIFSKLFLFLALCAGAGLFQACTDKDYDLDDIDKNGVIPIPPVPLGSFDTIRVEGLEELPEIPPIFLPQAPQEVAYKYVLNDLFNGSFVKNFFYEGAKDIQLLGLIDVMILTENSGLATAIQFKVLDEDYNEIPQIKIADQNDFIYGKNQPLKIVLESQYFKYFRENNATHLELNIVLRANSIAITEKDYIFLKELVLKTGGLHVEL